MPLITASLGLITATALIGLGTRMMSMSNVAPELALMIGLGVGIDYALFIVSRFRENYLRLGDVDQSVIVALGCAHPRRVKMGGRARAVARRTGRGCLPIAAISLVPVSPSIVWRGSLARIPGLLP